MFLFVLPHAAITFSLTASPSHYRSFPHRNQISGLR